MKISRRQLVAGTACVAVAPLTVVLPASASSVSVQSVPDLAAVALPREYPWKWWIGNSREIYAEYFDTREDAMEAAHANEYKHIAECRQQDFDLRVDADRVLEDLYCQNEDRVNEDGDFIDCTPEQCDDLSKMLTETMRVWALKHGINTTAWMFGDVRNENSLSFDGGLDAKPVAWTGGK